jgi:hypothetical protein
VQLNKEGNSAMGEFNSSGTIVSGPADTLTLRVCDFFDFARLFDA